MEALMLYVFDVDGTLVRGFIVTEECETCDRSGKVPTEQHGYAQDKWVEKCPDCKGKGFRFSKEHLPYDDVEVLPHRRNVMRALADLPGSKFAIATNQAGPVMDPPFQTFAQVYNKMGRVAAEFEHFHGRPFSIHMSMSHEKAKQPEYRTPEMLHMRKPNPGMLEAAMEGHLREVYPYDPREAAVYVGDLATDKQAAEACGMPFMWADEFFEREGWKRFT